jgi:hypothetical protein
MFTAVSSEHACACVRVCVYVYVCVYVCLFVRSGVSDALGLVEEVAGHADVHGRLL